MPPVADSSLLNVLRLLESNPRLSQREMAREMGISLGKTNYCVRALLAKGYLKVRNFSNNANKASYTYLLTPQGVAAKATLTRQFLQRKREEYEELRQEINRLQQEAESGVSAGIGA
ncbi:MAG TPA: MarR family EPS-associated transcriptional regulator [Gemmatimonadaceae bacterium]|nr:MarR family EPS-associated transcriptional regulator [Gemmatimonadaceae bacterium]